MTLRETGGLIIFSILTLACIATSLVGWATGWPVVGVVGFLVSICGGAMVRYAFRRITEYRGE